MSAGMALELWGESLLICTDSGCRPAGLHDMAQVVELLPDLLMRQDRDARRRHWLAMAEQQRKASREGGTA